MRPRPRPFLFASIAAIVAACGARSALIVPEPSDASPSPDAPPDIHHKDVTPPEEDALEEEALPPLDITPPPPDTFNECPDGASTLVYVISSDYHLMSFYPPLAQFTTIGSIQNACPSKGGSTPFSMAVDKTGIAYIVYNDGELFRVSTLTTACQPTGFVSGQQGYSTTFGMGFSRDKNGIDETLFVASDNFNGGGQTTQLASIDTTTFKLTVVGNFNPTIPNAELTGTGAGDLFGFYSTNGGADSAIGQIDKATAQVTNEAPLPGVNQGGGWAFAFWGGDFYTFTAPAGSTTVTRYRPSDGSITKVFEFAPPTIIVGAGVSTCAPQK